MNPEFVAILQKLIAEQGKETLLNTAKCKAFLSDYTRNEHKKESRFLLQALDAGVQKAIDTSENITICKLRQIRLLHEDYGLDEKVAVKVVDTLALVLRGDTARTQIKASHSAKPSKKTPSTTAAVTAPAAPSVESLMKRGKLFLEDSDWKQATEYFDRVLDIDPEYAPAYVGKLCAELKVLQEDWLGNFEEPISEYNNFKKAVRFADINYRAKLEGYNKSIKERIEEVRRQEQERERLERERIAKYQKCISTGDRYTVGLRADGTVVAVGDNKRGQCNTESWRDIVAITTGIWHTVGLRADGTVVAVGNYECDECNTGSWRDIVAIAAGGSQTVGLRADGTVVAVGSNDCGECNIESWRDIVAIAIRWSQTVGLRVDGTVVAVGNNDNGQCNTGSWRDIVAIVAGGHTVGLRADGTVVAVGGNYHGACETGSWQDIGPASEEQVLKWKQSLQ